jgi:hypothetical protein
MGCLFAVFTIPYNFIRWVIANGWKGLIVLVVVLVAILIGYFVIQGQINQVMAPKPTAPVNVALPSLKAAPFQINTPTRTYYALKAAANRDGTVMMTDWWEFLKGKWTLTKGTLVLDKTFGTATIRRR